MSIAAAIGGGRYDNGELFPVIKNIVSLAGIPNPNALYIPAAAFDFITGNELAPDILRQYGCKVATLFLTDVRLTPAEIERKIMSSHIIFTEDGNLNFLMSALKNTKADACLKKAFDKNIILSGTGTGAGCLFKDCYDAKNSVFAQGLGILPYSFFTGYKEENESLFKDHLNKCGLPGLGAGEGTCAVIKDGEISFFKSTETSASCIFNNETP